MQMLNHHCNASNFWKNKEVKTKVFGHCLHCVKANYNIPHHDQPFALFKGQWCDTLTWTWLLQTLYTRLFLNENVT